MIQQESRLKVADNRELGKYYVLEFLVEQEKDMHL